VDPVDPDSDPDPQHCSKYLILHKIVVDFSLVSFLSV
jgi:hypothetical protein